MPDNLIQKKGESNWYCRLAVPADVQGKLGCKVLVKSLETGSRKVAMDRKHAIVGAWKARIAAARAGRPLPEGWQDDVLLTQSIITEMFQGQKRALIGEAAPKLPEIDPAVQARMMGNPRFVAAFESFVREHLERGLTGKIELMDKLSKGITGLIPSQLTRAYDLPLDKQAEVRGVLASPASYKSSSPITPKRLDAYRTFRESRGGAQKHVDQQVTRMTRLSDFLKEKSLPLEFDSIDDWLLSMDRAPATLNQHLMAGTSFWDWAMKYDAGWRVDFKDKANPFKGHDLPQGGGKKTSGAERQIYTPAEAYKLHTAANLAGNAPLADLILLGWYSGGRVEELCQLKTTDVITVEGVQCFNFPRSKSKASERLVPVHPSLLPVVERLCKASVDGFLIPSDSKDKYGKRSHNLSKEFGKLRTKAGFGPLHVFHGFRHGFVTALLRGDVPEAIVQELVGHESKSVTHGVYSKGASIAQKLAAIEKLALLPKK